MWVLGEPSLVPQVRDVRLNPVCLVWSSADHQAFAEANSTYITDVKTLARDELMTMRVPHDPAWNVFVNAPVCSIMTFYMKEKTTEQMKAIGKEVYKAFRGREGYHNEFFLSFSLDDEQMGIGIHAWDSIEVSRVNVSIVFAMSSINCGLTQ